MFELWGADGGNNGGGRDGYASGFLILAAGDALYLYAGGRGGTAADTLIGSDGGWNDGGTGGVGAMFYGGSKQGGGGGGGGTDVRLGEGLNTRIIVAGGGVNGQTVSGQFGASVAGGFKLQVLNSETTEMEGTATVTKLKVAAADTGTAES